MNWGRSVSDFTLGSGDTITDFTRYEDRIDLSALKKFNAALHVTDTPEASGVWFLEQGGHTYVFIDSDGKQGADMAIRVKNVTGLEERDFIGFNVAPVIVGPANAPTATVSVAENQTFAVDVNAIDGNVWNILTYSIVGGADAGKFEIDSSTGVLSFVSAPNFESPTDVQIPTQAGHVFRFDRGHPSDLKPATLPI